MNASKLDLVKELRPLYSGKPSVIQSVVPGPHRYLCCDGRGDPNTSPEYKQAVEALFGISYQMKFEVRKTRAIDYGVMPLEGLWWSEAMEDFTSGDKANWKWTMMILQPAFITSDLVTSAKSAVTKKRRIDLDKVYFREYTENTCAQTMHVGPFSAEGPTIAALHEWIRSNGKALCGQHHEIYLTDIRRAAPARWKTIIRQPYQ